MQTLLLLSLLAQVATTRPGPVLVSERAPYSFSDGKRSFKLWESGVLVAEPSPTPERHDAVRALEPTATIVVDRPTMRVWKVRDAAALRTRLAELRPVFHDSPALIGRIRVPLGLVCAGERRDAPWLEVLQRSDGACLPDFWYPPVTR